MEMVNDFYENRLDLKRLNYGVISLIPKIKEANSIKNYRPICLINVSFKILTKLLAVRLGTVANKIINDCQTAFIKGRNILDRVLSLHEIVHEMRISKKRGIILKLDFEKAYDKVQWEFLEKVLRGKGFSDKWCRWVMSSIRGEKSVLTSMGKWVLIL